MSEQTYKLEQLAEAAGTTPRTVRYYVQRGLLPAPDFRGKDTVYTRSHLTILVAIRELSARHLPLDAIRVELERRARGEAPSRPAIEPAPGPPAALTPMDRSSVWHLARGLSLHLSDDASPETRKLADHLLDAARASISRKDLR